MAVSDDAKYQTAGSEISVRLLMRDAALILPITLSISIFGLVFSDEQRQLDNILLAIPFLTWLIGRVFSYHDGVLGLLSSYMADLEKTSGSTPSWHSNKGTMQESAHNHGGSTYRLVQHLTFGIIPVIAFILWTVGINFEDKVVWAIVGMAGAITVSSVFESFKTHLNRYKQSRK